MSGPIVLTNGAWHGAWCWSLVAEELAALGAASVAVELHGFGGLRGSGPDARSDDYLTARSSTADVTLEAAAEALVERVRRVGRGEPCTLVAHSLGGVVVTAAAELAPELVSRVVYVAALAPVTAQPASVYHTSPEMAGSLLPGTMVGDPGTTGVFRLGLRDAAARDLAMRSFYSDVDADRARAAVRMLTSDAPAGVTLVPYPVTVQRFGRLPHAYVLCTRDRILPPALQRTMIKDLDEFSGRPTTVYELDAGHSPFLSVPERLAQVLAELDGS